MSGLSPYIFQTFRQDSFTCLSSPLFTAMIASPLLPVCRPWLAVRTDYLFLLCGPVCAGLFIDTLQDQALLALRRQLQFVLGRKRAAS
jgi:hypothetical protein